MSFLGLGVQPPIPEWGALISDGRVFLTSAWWMASFPGVALAITNLLPLPALDGGRIIFVLIEGIRGRRVDPQRENMVHFVGFAVLLAVMLVFVFLDIFDPLITP